MEGPQLHPGRKGQGSPDPLTCRRGPPSVPIPPSDGSTRRSSKSGKPPKVAITAVMRKLVVLANALVQQDRLWTPEPPATA